METNAQRVYLYSLIGITLLGLGITALLAAVVSGSIVSTSLFFIYAILLQPPELPSTETLFLVGSGAGTCILTLLLWGEQHAPAHSIRAVNATHIQEDKHPELMNTVQLVAHQVSTPVPDIYIAPIETPFSFTTGFRPQTARLVISEGLLSILDQSEVEAVMAHEVAHIKNRDMVVMTIASLPIGATKRIFRLFSDSTVGVKYGQPSRADSTDLFITVGLILILPIWIVAVLCWAALSRTREFTADSGAISITGDPASLATALEKIDTTLSERPSTDLRNADISPLSIVEPPQKQPDFGGLPLPTRRLNWLVKTHPNTERRIKRLRKKRL
ncbi:M48 family metallopeptidase [Halostagnicola kamekurae]|nr:M48 family metalloprotease [Halostagnicola kamekurae]